MTLANAGHIPPYLNGEPVAMEGALPLGVMEDAEFSVMRFAWSEGDTLVLMSDGIAEATDADGQLFGFDRVHELLRTDSPRPKWHGRAALRAGRRHQRHHRHPDCRAGASSGIDAPSSSFDALNLAEIIFA